MGHNDKCFVKARLCIITVQPRRRPHALGDVAAAQENRVQRGVGSWRTGANLFVLALIAMFGLLLLAGVVWERTRDRARVLHDAITRTQDRKRAVKGKSVSDR